MRLYINTVPHRPVNHGRVGGVRSASMFDGEYFCATENCLLHVRAGDPGVHGSGEWARLGNALIVSRSLRDDGALICDLCRQSMVAAGRDLPLTG